MQPRMQHKTCVFFFFCFMSVSVLTVLLSGHHLPISLKASECHYLLPTHHFHCPPVSRHCRAIQTPRYARTGISLITCCSTWPTWASVWDSSSPPHSRFTWSSSDCCWWQVQRALPPAARIQLHCFKFKHCIFKYHELSLKCHTNALKQL